VRRRHGVGLGAPAAGGGGRGLGGRVADGGPRGAAAEGGIRVGSEVLHRRGADWERAPRHHGMGRRRIRKAPAQSE
jgi:hypothetical protein